MRGAHPDYVQQAAAPEAFVLSGHDEQDPHVTFMGTYQVVSGGRMHNGSPVYRKQGAFVTVRVKSFVGGGAEQTVTKKLNGSTVYYAYRAKSGKWIITDEESSMHVDRGTLVSSVALNLPTDAITAAERSGVVFEAAAGGDCARPFRGHDRGGGRSDARRADRPRGTGMVAENKFSASGSARRSRPPRGRGQEAQPPRGHESRGGGRGGWCWCRWWRLIQRSLMERRERKTEEVPFVARALFSNLTSTGGSRPVRGVCAFLFLASRSRFKSEADKTDMRHRDRIQYMQHTAAKISIEFPPLAPGTWSRHPAPSITPAPIARP